MSPQESRAWWVSVGLAVSWGAALACSGSISNPDDETATGAATAAPSGGSGGSASTSTAGSVATGSAGSGATGSGAGNAGSGGRASNGGSGSTAPAGGGNFCDAPALIFNTDTCGSSDRGCHADGSINGEFGTSEDTVRALLDEESVYGAECGFYIDSDNPEASLLFTMTAGTQNEACYPLQMPLQDDPLTPDEQDCIADWLSQF